ncbi:helix-turn-helix domain-containing protein, partial [Companilactobacillus futsaii]
FFMTKYSSEFKVKLVNEYLEGQISILGLAKKYGIPSKSPIYNWVHQAETNGLNSLKNKRSHKEYSQDFKLSVIEYYKLHEISRLDTAIHFKISPSQVSSWIYIYNHYGVAGLRRRPRGRRPLMARRKKKTHLSSSKEEKYKQEILDLKSKLHDTEMDRDILKALKALRENNHSSRKQK